MLPWSYRPVMSISAYILYITSGDRGRSIRGVATPDLVPLDASYFRNRLRLSLLPIRAHYLLALGRFISRMERQSSTTDINSYFSSLPSYCASRDLCRYLDSSFVKCSNGLPFAVIALAALSCLMVGGCGGGGGATKSANPVLIEQASSTIGAGGGSVQVSNVVVSLPPNSVSAGTHLSVATYSGVTNGNDKASQKASPIAQIGIDTTSLSDSTSIHISFGSAIPSPGAPVYVNLRTSNGIVPHSALFNAAQKTVGVTLNKADFISQPLGTIASVSSNKSYAVLSARIQLTPSSPEPRVDLYKFVKLNRIAKNADDSQTYEEDFGVNWSHPLTPDIRGHHVAIVVHGILNDLSNMTELAWYLKTLKASDGTKYYDDVYGCDCKWQASILQNARAFADILTAASDNKTSVDLFGHSQGGLILRSAIEQALPNRAFNGKILRLYTFGTPHSGVPPDVLRALVECSLVDTFYPGVSDLTSDSSFITALNADAAKPNGSTAYFTMCGSDYTDYIFTKYGTTIPFGLDAYLIEGGSCDGIVPVGSADGSVDCAQISGHRLTFQYGE